VNEQPSTNTNQDTILNPAAQGSGTWPWPELFPILPTPIADWTTGYPDQAQWLNSESGQLEADLDLKTKPQFWLKTDADPQMSLIVTTD
jgi:hypothetical protein